MNEREQLALGITRAVLISGKTESELALRMGVNQNTFYRWTTGASMPSPDNMRKLCYHLNVSPEDLRSGFPEFCQAAHAV